MTSAERSFTRRGRPVASPRALRALRRHGLDARQVQGSGPGGRIVESDVLAVADRPPEASSLRRGIARRTSESFARAPHFYLRAETDLTVLESVRRELLATFREEHGVRLSLTDLLLRAQALALRDCPQANRVWHNDDVLDLPTVDVGLVIAVEGQGTSGGLLHAVLRQVDRMPLAQLALERHKLVQAARAGRLPAGASGGGATSLTNIGSCGVDEFAAVIVPSQSTILAAGSLALRPFVVGNEVLPRHTMRLTLSADHRVLDGLPAAAYLDRILWYLYRPHELVLR